MKIQKGSPENKSGIKLTVREIKLTPPYVKVCFNE